MRNECIRAVKRYISDLTEELEAIPPFYAFENKFDRTSYSLWAAREILELLIKNPTKQPIDIATEFAEKMDSCSTYNEFISWSFSVSYDSAMAILDEFIAIKQKHILKEI